jgi:hypothetical protein
VGDDRSQAEESVSADKKGGKDCVRPAGPADGRRNRATIVYLVRLATISLDSREGGWGQWGDEGIFPDGED